MLCPLLFFLFPPPIFSSISSSSTLSTGTSTATNSTSEGVPPLTIVSANTTNSITSNFTKEYFSIEVNATSFNIGALIPLSVMGVASLEGVFLAETLKCAIDLTNNNRGILPNTFITYSIQDTDTDIDIATNQGFLLERRSTFAVVGPQSDDIVLPVINLYNTVNIPSISYGAGSTFLNNGTVYPTFFRTWPGDSFQARAMAETFRLLGWTFISALFTNDQYGQSGR